MRLHRTVQSAAATQLERNDEAVVEKTLVIDRHEAAEDTDVDIGDSGYPVTTDIPSPVSIRGDMLVW